MRKRATWAAIFAVLALILAACATTATHPRSVIAPGDHGNVEATAPGPATAPHCGVERWAVKTGTDSDVSQVNLSAPPTQAGIEGLGKLPVPPTAESLPDNRSAPVEVTVYEVHGFLTQYTQEADGDYHLVLDDGQGHSMIAEIPAPACVGQSSPFLPAITAVRAAFEAKFAPGNFWQPAGNIPVVVDGVGFFDRLHGQTGVAPNGIELHPVLSLGFGTSPPSAAPSVQSAGATRLVTGSPGPLQACFGYRGVEFGTFNAWLCEVKLGGDPSGSLYFTPSVDTGLNDANPNGQMVWYKLHAAPNAYYVWENYSQPWGSGDTVRANGRIIALDEGVAGQCILNWPSWTVMPTQCTPVSNGGATVGAMRPLNLTEQYSVAEYIKNGRQVPLEYR